MLSGLLVIPGVSCLWVLPYVLIKYYHLSLYPRLRVPVPPSCVHRDTYTSSAVINFFFLFLGVHFEGKATFGPVVVQERLKTLAGFQ